MPSNSLDNLTTTPPKAKTPSKLGITISPLKQSAIDHTKSTFIVAPSTITITTIRAYIFVALFPNKNLTLA